jgi:hypothetical protein
VWRVLRFPSARASELATIAAAAAPRCAPDGARRSAVARARELRAFAALSRGATPLMPEGLRRMGPAYLRARRGAMAHGDFAPALEVAEAA